MSTATNVIVDACTLKNFSVIGRIGVLDQHFAGRARWTDAIQVEAGRLGVPDLDWLGPAISAADNVEAVLGILNIRAMLGADSADPPTLHLGEAEAIYVLQHNHPDWAFVSDDRPAVDLARTLKLAAMESKDVLADCYDNGEVGCPEAFNLLKSMVDAGRGVRVPASHWQVCPPRGGDDSGSSPPPGTAPELHVRSAVILPGRVVTEPDSSSRVVTATTVSSEL